MFHKNRRIAISDLLTLLLLGEKIVLSSSFFGGETMVFSTQRALILLICIGFLAVKPDKVSGMRSIDLVLRQNRHDHMLAPKNQRILKAVSMEDLNKGEKSATVNKKFDLNQSSKRRVRRGSDPIHNRS